MFLKKDPAISNYHSLLILEKLIHNNAAKIFLKELSFNFSTGLSNM